MTVPISRFFVGVRSQHDSTWSTHVLDLKEVIVHSYLEEETTRTAAETFKARPTLPLLRSLIFIEDMDAESRVHILHLAVDVRF